MISHLGAWIVGGVTCLLVAVWLMQERAPVDSKGRPRLKPNWTPRGGSLDSVYQRWLVLWLMLRAMLPGKRLYVSFRGHGRERGWWWFGYGPRATERAIIAWASHYGIDAIPLGHAHVDIVQFWLETGPLGVATAALLCWQVFPHLAWGDPWSAAWIAGVVLGFGSIPFRCPPVGLLWLVISAKLAGGL